MILPEMGTALLFKSQVLSEFESVLNNVLRFNRN